MHTKTNTSVGVTLTSALQPDGVVVLAGLTVTLVAAHIVQTEASFAHLLTEQRTLIGVCRQGGEVERQESERGGFMQSPPFKSVV